MSVTYEKYSATARVLHWIIAVLIIGQFIGGWLMTHQGVPASFRYEAFQLHKSFGLSVMLLSFVRLAWRFQRPPPALPSGMKPWEEKISHLTHVAFYALMIGVPFIGWMIVSAEPSQVPTKLFFLIPWPHLPLPHSAGVTEIVAGLHEFFAFATIGLLALHIGAAMKHHYLEKDVVLLRMAGGKLGALIATAFAAAAVVGVVLSMALNTCHPEEDPECAADAVAAAEGVETSSVPTAAGPNAWTIVDEETFVEATLVAQGASRTARLPAVTGTILLDPSAPERVGEINVTIDVRSLESDEDLVESEAKSANWLATGRYPSATFYSEAITRDGEVYVADGMLSIRGVSAPLILPFVLSIEGDTATATADVTFSRELFEIGVGEDGEDEVSIALQVVATRG